MKNNHAVIFTGVPVGAMPMGAYRLRTEASKRDYHVQVIDFSWALTPDVLSAICKKYITPDTKIVGLSSNWVDVNWKMAGREIGQFIKTNYPNVLLIEGGQRPIKTIPQAKWWFRGFSDISWIKFLEHIYQGAKSPIYTIMGDGTRVVNSDLNYAVTDYNSLGTTWIESDPISSITPLPIEIGRGCIFQCAFCHHPFLGKKKGEYTRSIDSIAYEFKRNFDMFGTTKYQFIDDTFNDSEEKIQLVLDARDKAGVEIEFVCYLRAELIATQPQTIPMLIELGLRSAHVGIESFNMQGRKAVGKGLDINRVLDAIAKTRSDSHNRVTFWATLIAGLPGDTIDSVLKQAEWCNENRSTHLQAWWHYPLNINPNSFHLSSIEKDPIKYGYEITQTGWKSSSMTFIDAKDVSTKINEEYYRENMRASGYLRAYGWGSGLSDEFLDSTPFLDIKFSKYLEDQATTYFGNILCHTNS